MRRSLLLLGPLFLFVASAFAGNPEQGSPYSVLEPMTSGNLTIFPVVSRSTYDTSAFLTLDEGLKSGEVEITEMGKAPRPLVRGPRSSHYVPESGAQVNRLALLNKSKRPLLLLAGEIVTGGNQDRVIGKDRIVPPSSDPIDLDVFCVEPGRWTERSANFGALTSQMAQPSVRGKAMVDKNQQRVWDAVRGANETVEVTAGPPPVETSTSSYAAIMGGATVQKKVADVAAPIERSYSSLMRQLKDQHAVGVVVAVNGEIIWADLFASTDLLEKYWPKLIRSYAAEAMTSKDTKKHASKGDAEKFLAKMEGPHQTIDTDPGMFRSTETTGDGYRVLALTSLMPKSNFDVHVSKIKDLADSAQLKVGDVVVY